MKYFHSLLSLSGYLLFNNKSLLKYFLNYKTDSLRIVYYHAVTDDALPYYFDGKAITPKQLNEQLIFYKKHYEIISLSEAIHLAKNNKSLKKKLVITFDDGFKLNIKVVAPLLLKHKVTAAFFLIGNCIDNKDLMWRNKIKLLQSQNNNKFAMVLADLCKVSTGRPNKNSDLMKWTFFNLPMKYKDTILNDCWDEIMDCTLEDYLNNVQPYLSSNDIKELNDSGFEFGSHSSSHPIFSKISYEEFNSEIIDSVKKIEEITKKEVRSFSYPFGRRAPVDFEDLFQREIPCRIDTFLGTRNKMRNLQDTNSWQRDNVEHDFNIAISRFFIIAALRNKIKYF